VKRVLEALVAAAVLLMAGLIAREWRARRAAESAGPSYTGGGDAPALGQAPQPAVTSLPRIKLSRPRPATGSSAAPPPPPQR